MRSRRAALVAAACALVPGLAFVGPGTAASGASKAAPSIVAAPVQVASTSDGSVSYRSIGSGNPAIVLIMGYSASMDAWEPLFIDALARTHRVVIFDNAGIGQTSMPAGTLTISTMADQTAALISALHLSHPDVLGWSMGGMIAQALAVGHPGDVGRLALAATFSGDGKAKLPSGSAASLLEHPTKTHEGTLLGLLFPPGHSADEKTYEQQITSFPNFTLASASVEAAQLSAIVNWAGGKDHDGAGVSHLKMPVLIADGTDDALIPTADDHELARTIPHSHLVLYPDAGHGFLFQDEHSFLGKLESFFG